MVKDISIGHKAWGSISEQVTLDVVSSAARYRSDVSSELRRSDAKLRTEMSPATRYTFQRNTASIMKI